MFTTIVALSTIGIQIATVIFVVLWVRKSPLLEAIYRHSSAIMIVLFMTSVLGSLIYEYGFGYEPCLLCWYQRIAIFGVAILSLTGSLRTNKTLQRQIVIFCVLGAIVALVHNFIDIVPTGIDICGTGPSCLKRYIYEFDYITIPMMSLTVLVAGAVLSFFTLKRSTTPESLSQ